MISSTQTHHPLTNFSASDQTVGSSLEKACNRLKSAGLRITQPRIAILTALINRNQPATIEQIHLDLKDSACDLVTVYRCLAAFEELALVRRCFFYNGTSLYQIQLDNDPIYHVVSKEGEVLETIAPELAKELSAVFAKIDVDLKSRGFADTSHMAAFFAGSAVRQPSAVSAK